MQTLSADVETASFPPLINNTSTRTLPVVFVNRHGEIETTQFPGQPDVFSGDGVPFSDRSTYPLPAGLTRQPEHAALNRLRRALFETGQLIVTTEDGASRVCFAGVGDPETLFVEILPRDEPVPLLDFESPGCLCRLEEAEAILRRLYRGDSSEELARFLSLQDSSFRNDSRAA